MCDVCEYLSKYSLSLPAQALLPRLREIRIPLKLHNVSSSQFAPFFQALVGLSDCPLALAHVHTSIERKIKYSLITSNQVLLSSSDVSLRFTHFRIFFLD